MADVMIIIIASQVRRNRWNGAVPGIR